MRRISSSTGFSLSAMHSYKNPISILLFFLFFAHPLENRRNRRPTWPVYIIIYWYSDTSGFFIIITICHVHEWYRWSEIRVRSTTLAGNARVTFTIHDDIIITTDNFFPQTSWIIDYSDIISYTYIISHQQSFKSKLYFSILILNRTISILVFFWFIFK